MKTIKTNAWQLLIAIAALVLLAGCSDGEMASNANLDITPPAPIIISFYAEPSEIAAGQSTTIAWEVAGADKVEIAAVAADGSAVSFGVSTDQLSGSQAVNGLASTTDFVLTATKSTDSLETETETTDEAAAIHVLGGQIQYGPEEEEAEETPETSEAPAVSSVTQTITVTVLPANELAATITADVASVPAGESTIIRWTVTPSENLSAVGVVADSGEAIVATDSCSGDMASILAQPALDEFPAVGCAVVTPSVATTYTINAQDSVGNVATASVLVGLTSGQITADIKAAESDSATPKDALEVTTWQSPVVVSWSVTPASAKVSIVATGSVEAASTAAPCELPVDASDKTTGSTKCKLAGETTFTITATVGTDSATDSVNVKMKGSTGTPGLVIANSWAFHTESVNLEMKLDVNALSMADSIEKVMVASKAISAEQLTTLKTGVPIVVPTVADVTLGQYVNVDLVYNGGQTKNDKPVQIVDLEKAESGKSGIKVTSAKLMKDDSNEIHSYVGVMMDGFNNGMARIYKDGGANDISFYEMLKEAFDYDIQLWFFEDKIVTYPVAVEPIDANNDYIIAGITGGVYRYRQNDKGEYGWDSMVTFPRYVKGNVETSHPTCGRNSDGGGQNIQTGDKKDFDGDLVSLNQVCDIVVIGDTRLLVATDYGVMVASGFKNDIPVWMGVPDPALSAEEMAQDPYGFLTFSHVVNDLQMVGDKVYAALDQGVVVSKNGIHWDNTGFFTSAVALDGNNRENQNPVWALAYDSRNKVLYAGHEKGIKYFDTTADSDCDPDNPDMPCDSGWKDLSMPSETPVISLAVDPSAPTNTVAILAGTPDGLMVTRDRGLTWSQIQLGNGGEAVTAMALDSVSAGSTVQYKLMVGTSTGKQFFRTPYVDKESTGTGFRPVDGTVVGGGGSGDTPADISKVNATLVLN